MAVQHQHRTEEHSPSPGPSPHPTSHRSALCPAGVRGRLAQRGAVHPPHRDGLRLAPLLGRQQSRHPAAALRLLRPARRSAHIRNEQSPQKSNCHLYFSFNKCIVIILCGGVTDMICVSAWPAGSTESYFKCSHSSYW